MTITTNNELLIINRHTCPRIHNVSIQALLLDLSDMTIVRTFPRMSAEHEYMDFFTSYKNVIITDVTKVSMLDKLNIIKQ